MGWADWESGDCVCAPDRPGTALEQTEILRQVAGAFRHVEIDWAAGDRWVEARIARALTLGMSGVLLEAEQALLGRSVSVLVADDISPEAVYLRFYMTPDTGCLELQYPSRTALVQCRTLAQKVAGALGYEFVPWPDDHSGA